MLREWAVRVALAIASVVIAPGLVRAEPGGRCEGGTCDVDQGPRPWVLTDDCQETSDVVGHRRCGQFAQWSAEERDPDLFLELGVGVRHVMAPRPVVTDQPTSSARTTTGPAPTPLADIVTSELRLGRAFGAFYAAGELVTGDLTGKAYTYGAFIQGGGVFGVEEPLGPFDVGAEAMVGGRSVRLATNINLLAPADTGWVVEARAHAALWLTPWITLGAEVGAGVIDRSEWVGAIMLGVHTRAYGGRR
jgi:hypothetical protein